MDFYDKHKNSIKNVVLEKNYRSSQEILDVAKSSIDFNHERIANEI
jgi:superfamily I DNA/RNA helicase